ncbi:MAG: DUF4338 domain-containing protein [Deltaproteobacteria bacterium]|nr:DUF4338 domain-containing protein [Deltaproteobacteria bacterium]
MSTSEPGARDPIPVPTLTGPRPLLRRARAVVQALLAGQLEAATLALDALDADRVERTRVKCPPAPGAPDAGAPVPAAARLDAPPGAPKEEGAAERYEGLRVAMYARLLVDLVAAGWRLEEELGRLFLIPLSPLAARSDEELLAAKSTVRRTMDARVRSSLRAARVGALVSAAEPRVRALMADPRALAEALRSRGPSAVKPYVELARAADGAESPDPTTGLSRYTIFVYMRWWWSFPYNDSPGRSLPFLIRDAGQPGHPVCGLLCLASPVLRMTQRDSALGLSTAWLQAVVAGLLAAADGPAALEELLRAIASSGGPARATLWPQLAKVLQVVDLERWARGTPPAARAEAAEAAAARLLQDLIEELRGSEALIDRSGLRIDPAARLEDQIAALRDRADAAERLWRRLRGVSSIKPEHSAAVDAIEAELRASQGGGQLSPRDALFVKKRHRQLARLWEARAQLEALRARGAPLKQLAAALRAHELYGPAPARRQRGAGPSAAELKADGQALGAAMEERRVRVLAAQVAEVTVCGAVPPYNAVLGGKLAAVAALSREVAAAWRSIYGSSRSDITSRMAGRDVTRDADLLALSTTGFYGVGNAQYNRAVLPWQGAQRGWREAGLTAGHGTLHLSDATAALGRELLEAKRGGKLINSQFGEGPSERLRSLRDAINEVGLPANDLLQHGAPRVIFVAPLDGAPPYKEEGSWSTKAPTLDEVTELWRGRWLNGRLQRAAAELTGMEPPGLLSERYPEEVAAALAANATSPQAVTPVGELSDEADDQDDGDLEGEE